MDWLTAKLCKDFCSFPNFVLAKGLALAISLAILTAEQRATLLSSLSFDYRVLPPLMMVLALSETWTTPLSLARRIVSQQGDRVVVVVSEWRPSSRAVYDSSTDRWA